MSFSFSQSRMFTPFRLKIALAFAIPFDRSMSAIKDSNYSSSLPTKTIRVEIKGRVQGVFFRDWTVENATELGLRGWVRNRRNGAVEAVFSGDPDAVKDMVERRCKIGPPFASIDAVLSFPWDEDPGLGFQRKPTV